MRPHVVAVLAAHNRRASTVACLENFFSQRADATLGATLVDAGSQDGTASAVSEQFPDVQVLRRSNDLYWASGMRVAMAAALERSPDFLLWLNDDTYLDGNAVQRLLDGYNEMKSSQRLSIVVGAVRDPDTGETTYGGAIRPSRWRPMYFETVPASDETVQVDTMNGNSVLISKGVVDRIGFLDARYSHGMGDYDYGLRARMAGIAVIVVPGTVGTCRRNPRRELTSVREEWSVLRSAKGIPLAEWAYFCRRWAGPAWPLYTVSPYVRRLSRAGKRSAGVGRK